MSPAARSRHEPGAGAADLAARVLSTLLAEDYAGLRSHVRDGALRVPGARPLPLRPGSFLTELEVTAATRDDLWSVLRAVADPRDDVAALLAEYDAAGTPPAPGHGIPAKRTATETRPNPRRRAPADHAGTAGTAVAGAAGPGFETVAARAEHPVYPLSRARVGLSADEVRRYAPEFGPRFGLRWAAVPAGLATLAGERPGWWPLPEDVGLDDADALFPVHPLAVPHVAGVAPLPYLEVGPTLSMRTVAVDEVTQVKLPLPMSTLGLRNRRSIVPRTLVDGAVVQRLLAPLLDGGPLLLADEGTYGHAGDPMLGYLVRRLPVAGAPPVAALAAPAGDGRLVIETLGDAAAVFGGYLEVLFRTQVRLFTLGVALESHQQNLALIPGDPPRLLVKDHDGPLVHADVPGSAELLDRRLVTTDPEALARVFVTITLHLCAAAPAYALDRHGVLPLRRGLALVREHLDAALTAYGAAFLRARTLDADTLPAKAMLTAGTLVGKDRTGAADVNKHYGPPVPNYLRGSHP